MSNKNVAQLSKLWVGCPRRRAAITVFIMYCVQPCKGGASTDQYTQSRFSVSVGRMYLSPTCGLRSPGLIPVGGTCLSHYSRRKRQTDHWMEIGQAFIMREA
jgi:hypothetical protein